MTEEEEEGQVPRGKQRKGIKNRALKKKGKKIGEEAANIHFGDVQGKVAVELEDNLWP